MALPGKQNIPLKKIPKPEPTREEQLEALKSKEKELDREIAELLAKGIDADLQPQMQALHRYNEMKDSTQMVLGYLADVEQTTVTELHKRFDLPLN